MAIVAPRDFRTLDYPKGPEYFPHHFAFVIDGVVEEILHTHEDLSQILNSNFTARQTESDSELLYKIELLVDNVVKDTLTVSERFASILLSNPTVVSFDFASNLGIKIKDLYNANIDRFSNPPLD